MDQSRRSFLVKSGIGIAALVNIPAIVSAVIPGSSERKNNHYPMFKRGSTILFQGDSITEYGREKEKELPNNAFSIGPGYVYLLTAQLMKTLPNRELIIYNRGISGNKVFQLANRWQKDCLDLKPDILSILIGVNDYWYLRNGMYDGTVADYERDYRALLNRTKEHLPDVTLIIGQPFVLPNTEAVDETWIEPMKGYQQAAKRVADDINTLWVPYQQVFNEALKYAPATYWTTDGVHPSVAGTQLMAEAWLKVVS